MPGFVLWTRRGWRAVFVVLTLFSSAVVATPHLAMAAAESPTLFLDTFDGPAGGLANADHWLYNTTANNGWGNGELEYYTSGGSNAFLDGQGNLVLEAREQPNGTPCWYGPCRYTSARLFSQTKFTFTYGHVRARIKMDVKHGLWPALWMVGADANDVPWPDCGEIDIMENFGSSEIAGSIHGPDFAQPPKTTDRSAIYDLGKSQDDWHVYGLDWYPGRVDWSIDGKVYESVSQSSLGSAWVFDKPFYLLVNLAVGGKDVGNPGDGALPTRLLVDYISVYQ